MKKQLLYCTLASAMLISCNTKQANTPSENESLDISAKEYGPYTISLISQNIWHIQDYNRENPAGESFGADGSKSHFNNCSDLYLLRGSEKALLVDLSNYIEWNDSAITSLRHIVAERVGDLPLTITFTHNHGDHVGMMPAYQNDTTVQFALSQDDFSDRLEHFPASQYLLIDEGYLFDLGDIKVNTIKVPGHTAGSVVFDVKGRNLLLTGDAIGSGHGVWIFNTEGFNLYREAVPHLVSYVTDPQNGIDSTALRIFGGHYWQKDWMDQARQGQNAPTLTPLEEGKELGMNYLRDMEQLVKQIEASQATSEPSGLNIGALDTYFINGAAIVVWNQEQAQQLANELK